MNGPSIEGQNRPFLTHDPQQRFSHLRGSSLTIAIQKLDGTARLICIPDVLARNDEQGLKIIQQTLRHTMSSSFSERMISVLLTEAVAGTARINIIAINPGDHNSFRISLHDFAPDPLLTEIWNSPGILREENVFIGERASLLHDQKILVVRHVLDKTKVARELLCLLCLSPVLASLLGVLVRPNVGIAVGAGVFALASFLQALANWFST